MKLTELDIKTFKALASSGIGVNLLDYLVRLEAYVCDSRSWGPDDTRESANRAAEIIKQELRGKITVQMQKKTTADVPDDFS